VNLTGYNAVATEAMFAGQYYEYLPITDNDKLPRIKLWRDKSKQPSGVIVSNRIKSGEYVVIRPDNGWVYGTGQVSE
jgi:hypothetical protein